MNKTIKLFEKNLKYGNISEYLAIGLLDYSDISKLANIDLFDDEFHIDHKLSIADNMTLLQISIMRCNLSVMLFCIRNKANIHIIMDKTGYSLLHLSVFFNNVHSLKYFISKGLFVNHKDLGNSTPLSLACRKKNIKCLKILLQNGSDTEESFLEVISWFVIGSEHYETALIFLENMIDYVKNITKENMCILEHLIYNRLTIPIKIIVDKFPEVLDRNINEQHETLINIAIAEQSYEITNYMLNKTSKLLKKNKIGATYLHDASSILDTSSIKLIIEKCPQIVNELDDNNNSAINYAIIPKGILKKIDSDIINSIKILVENGCNINYFNKYKLCALSLGIQYCSSHVVKGLIDLGCNIYTDNDNLLLNKNDIWIPLNTNDFIGYAIHMNKLVIVKLLIENNTPLYFIEIKLNNTTYIIHTCLLLAVIYGRSDIINYLLELNIIKNTINEYTKKYLFDQAINDGCHDIDILKKFTSNKLLNQIHIDDMIATLEYKQCVTFFSRFFPDYEEKDKSEKNFIIENIYILLDIITDTIKLCHKTKKPFSEKNLLKIRKLLFKMEQFTENVKHEDHILYFNIVSIKIGSINVSTIGTILDSIKNMHRYYYDKSSWDNDFICNIDINFTCNDEMDQLKVSKHKSIDNKSNQGSSEFLGTSVCIGTVNKIITYVIKSINKSEIDILNNFFDRVTSLYVGDKKKELIDLDIENLLQNVKIQSTDNKIKYSLIKLLWPVKVDHYDFLYDKLLSSFAYFDEHKNVEQSKQIKIGMDDIEFSVISLTTQKPSKWFKFYGKNIAKPDKLDIMHMFPFSLDYVLKNFQCIEINIEDPTNYEKEGMNTMLYFYGFMHYENTNSSCETKSIYKTIYGCYEYFINSRGTLFHRMFRPLYKLPIEIQNSIKQNCTTEINKC